MGNKSQTDDQGLTGSKKFQTPFDFEVSWTANPPSPEAQITVSGPGSPQTAKLTLQSPRWSFVLKDGDHEVDGVLTIHQRPKLIELNASIKVASNEAFVGCLSSWSSEPTPPQSSTKDDDEDTKAQRKAKRDRASK